MAPTVSYRMDAAVPRIAAFSHRLSPRASLPLKAGALVLLAVLFTLSTNALDGGTGIAPHALWTAPAWAPWYAAPWRMLANALPGLLLALALLALLRKATLSFVLAFAVEAL